MKLLCGHTLKVAWYVIINPCPFHYDVIDVTPKVKKFSRWVLNEVPGLSDMKALAIKTDNENPMARFLSCL